MVPSGSDFSSSLSDSMALWSGEVADCCWSLLSTDWAGVEVSAVATPTSSATLRPSDLAQSGVQIRYSQLHWEKWPLTLWTPPLGL